MTRGKGVLEKMSVFLDTLKDDFGGSPHWKLRGSSKSQFTCKRQDGLDSWVRYWQQIVLFKMENSHSERERQG